MVKHLESLQDAKSKGTTLPHYKTSKYGQTEHLRVTRRQMERYYNDLDERLRYMTEQWQTTRTLSCSLVLEAIKVQLKWGMEMLDVFKAEDQETPN